MTGSRGGELRQPSSLWGAPRARRRATGRPAGRPAGASGRPGGRPAEKRGGEERGVAADAVATRVASGGVCEGRQGTPQAAEGGPRHPPPTHAGVIGAGRGGEAPTGSMLGRKKANTSGREGVEGQRWGGGVGPSIDTPDAREGRPRGQRRGGAWRRWGGGGVSATTLRAPQRATRDAAVAERVCRRRSWCGRCCRGVSLVAHLCVLAPPVDGGMHPAVDRQQERQRSSAGQIRIGSWMQDSRRG